MKNSYQLPTLAQKRIYLNSQYFQRVTLFVATIFMVISLSTLYAQTGPGGVGNSGGGMGQPRNILWLDASNINQLTGTAIPTWTDKSGNGFSANQVTAGNQPKLTKVSANFNNKSAVLFTTTGTPNQFLNLPAQLNTTTDGILNQAYTAIVVGRRTGLNANSYLLGGLDNGPTNSNLQFFWVSATTEQFRWGQYGNDIDDGSVAAATTNAGIFTGVFDPSATNSRELFKNSTSVKTSTSTAPMVLWNSPMLGRYINTYQNIEIAEVIFFQGAINAAQRILIDNYLNAKYAIAIVNDFYTNATHNIDVAGIGKSGISIQTNASSAGFYAASSAATLGNGEWMLYGHSSTLAISSALDLPATVSARLDRSWAIQKTGSLDATISFDFSEIYGSNVAPTNASNYVLLYRSGTSGNFSITTPLSVNITKGDNVSFSLGNSLLLDGYYTLGTKDNTSSPILGAPVTASSPCTWYTLKDGNWNDPTTWTLDAAGSIPNNPSNYTPLTSPTSTLDNVVILAGKRVTVTDNNLYNNSLNIQGTLDLGTSTMHTFGSILGFGRIRMAGDNFPTGNATDFATPSMGGGTLEYYGSSFSLNNAISANNLEINPNSGQKITLISNYVINGNLLIRAGAFQINDNLNAIPINLTVYGDVTVNAGTTISVGTANTTASSADMFLMHHQFVTYGNFTNNGTVKLTNETAPLYNANTTNGAANLVFAGLSNSTLNCVGTTDINTLQLNKGVDATYQLEIYASDKSNFRLFGKNNGPRPNIKALSIQAGTLKLTGQIVIPTLGEGGGDWGVPAAGGLWIAGPNVKVYSTADNSVESLSQVPTGAVGVDLAGTSNQAMTVEGVFRITDGLMSTRNSAGFIFWTIAGANAIVNIEGGICDVSQFRAGIAGGKTSLIMTGGTLNVRKNVGYGTSEYTATYPQFYLDANSALSMSGGEIILSSQSNLTSLGFEQMNIATAPSNANVTGGKITIANTGTTTTAISTTVNLWNLDISRHTTAAIADRPLVILYSDIKILNTLNITDYATLAATDNSATTPIFKNISVGGDLIVSSFGSLADIVPAKPAQSINNTITLNGTNNSILTFSNKKLPADIQNFYKLIIDKPSNRNVTLNAAKSSFLNEDNNLLQINGPLLKLNGGTLSLNNYSIVSYADSIVNNGTLGLASTGNDLLKLMNKTSVLISGTGSSFGNVRLSSKSNIVTLNENAYFKRLLWTHGRMKIGTFNLKLDELKISLDAAETLSSLPSVQDMFITTGQASDGGLSLLIPASGNNPADGSKVFLFPVGIGTDGVDQTAGGASRYTYAKATISGTTTGGYITANPNDGELKTTSLAANNLNYFWRLRSTGFTAQPSISEMLFKYYTNDAPSKNATWVPGKVLDGTPYTRASENANQVDNPTGNTIRFIGASNPYLFTNANYTMGLPTAFTGSVIAYYSRTTTKTLNGTKNGLALWDDKASWNTPTAAELALYSGHDTRCTKATAFPVAGDVVYVGYAQYGDPGVAAADLGEPHTIVIDKNLKVACAEVNFTQMKNALGNPTSRRFASNYAFRPTVRIDDGSARLTTDLVRGEGSFWCYFSDPNFDLMDFSEFAQNDSSYVSYEATGTTTISNSPAAYPNLLLTSTRNGSSRATITFTKNIKSDGNLEILGDCDLQLNNTATGNLTIAKNLLLFESSIGGNSGGGASILFPRSGIASTISIDGNIILRQPTSGAKISIPSNTNSNGLINELHVKGNIIQNQKADTGSGIILYNSTGTNVVNLYLEGSTSMTFTNTSGNNPILNRLIINKGTSIATTANWTTGFTLNAPTSGAGVAKALQLTNGLFIIDNASTNINLTTGNDNFSIPTTAGLELRQGTVNATGTSNIALDGLLRNTAGSINMAGGANNIIYSASPSAIIEINGGSLNVGGAIRRQDYNDLGLLKYRQTAGTVIIGASTIVPVVNRGIFEVLNSGSEFTHTGGALTLRQQASATIGKASLILNPTTYSTTGATINIFDASTPAGQTNFAINSTIPFGNLVINGTNSPKVLSLDHDLLVNGNFTIATGATYLANNFDQYFKGNVTIAGTFTASSPNALAPSGTTLNMIGTTNQAITGTISLYNYSQNNLSNTVGLGLTSPLTIGGKMTITSGIFDGVANTVNLKGDLENNGIIKSTLTGISLNGTLVQDIRGNGEYDILTFDNSAGLTSASGSSLLIQKSLRMNKGVFSTGGNLVTFSSVATIVPLSAFSNTNMIMTNVSVSDAGIRKYLPAGASAFTYPLGKLGKYNPITLTVTANTSSTGYFSVNAANERHPATISPFEVLKYYWIFKTSGLSGFSGNAVMAYQGTDAVLTTHTTADYISARILSSLVANPTFAWNKYDTSFFDEVAKTVTFDFNGVDDAGISGDYTAGVDASIPAIVPIYTSTKDGLWTDVTAWTPAPPAGGPSGSRVIVNHYINMPTSYTSSYIVQINSSGTLDIPANSPQRLGNLDGNGTLKMNSSGLPAGDFTDFMAATASTIEFGGDADYDILPLYSTFNNVTISGTGKRYLPSTDIIFNGNLIITGTNTSLELRNDNNINLDLNKNLNFTQGAFYAGSSSAAKISFTGSVAQKINGPLKFTGSNALKGLEINNTNGLSLFTDVDINKALTFVNGKIWVGDLNALNVQNSSAASITGASSTNYVEGTFGKQIISGDQFTFPIGDGSRYGEVTLKATATTTTCLWQAKYFNSNATSAGYNTSSFDASLYLVSSNEYWKVLANETGSPKATVVVRWDASSGIGNTANDFTDLRQAMWDNASGKWNASGNTKTGTYAAGTVASTAQLTFNNIAGKGNIIAIGNVTIPTSISWNGNTSTDWFTATNWSSGSVPTTSKDVVIPASPTAGRFPTVGSSSIAYCKGLNIALGATLTLLPASKMTIEGNLVNSGTIIIQNSVSGIFPNPPATMASLITNGAVNTMGATTVQTTIPRGTRYWYSGFSVNDPIGTGMTSAIWNAADAINTFAYKYNAAAYSRFTTNDVKLYDNPKPGVLNSYSVKLLGTGTTTLTSTGTLNNGDYTTTPSADDWALLCNPYPSSIDMLANYQNNLSNYVPSGGKLDATIWVTVNGGGVTKYATFNFITGVGQNGGTKILPPGQGFWMANKTQTPGTFTVSQSARVHSAVALKSMSNTSPEAGVLRIEATNKFNITDEVVLAFNPAGVTTISTNDALKKMGSGTNILNFYTLKGNKAVAINVMPLLETEVSIPLAYSTATAGDVTIHPTNLTTFDSDIDVWLEDKATGETVNLRQMEDVTIAAASGNSIDRLILHFKPAEKAPSVVATALIDKNAIQARGITISQKDNHAIININTEASIDAKIEILTQNGIVVSSTNTKMKVTTIAIPASQQVYIVRVVNGFDAKTAKVVGQSEK